MIMFYIFLSIIGFFVTFAIGSNDAANSIASAVGSKALSWRQASIIGSIAEIIGASFLSTHVISTIATDIFPLDHFPSMASKIAAMISVVISAGLWSQISSIKGMPVSTTHSIIGSIIGIGISEGGFHLINWDTVKFISVGWILSPIVCGALCYISLTIYKKIIFEADRPLFNSRMFVIPLVYALPIVVGISHIDNYTPLNISILFIICGCSTTAALLWYSKTNEYNYTSLKKKSVYLNFVQWVEKLGGSEGDLCRKPSQIFKQSVDSSSIKKSKREARLAHEIKESQKSFKMGQVVTSFLSSLSHGSNDVANGIAPLAAIIWIVKGLDGSAKLEAPPFLLLIGGIGIASGIILMGKSVVETVGTKMMALNPFKGFVVQLGSSITVLACSYLGLPVSTTHALIGGLIGTNLANKTSGINFITLVSIFISWIATIPFCMVSSVIINKIVLYSFIGLKLF